MAWGLLARAENRGLGLLCAEYAAHLHPDKTLIVDLGDLCPYVLHTDRFDSDQRITQWRGAGLDRDDTAWLLEGVDRLLIFETPYDYSLYDQARAAGVETITVAMPEFWPAAINRDLPLPDRVIWPTTWLHDRAPAGTPILPPPVATERFTARQRTQLDTLLMPAGHPTRGDRNGLKFLWAALRQVRSNLHVVVRSQQPVAAGRVPSNIDIEVAISDAPDYWTLYDEADMAVMPRRWGGLCLPLVEAAAAGVPMLMPDCAPQNTMLPERWLTPTATGPQRRSRCQSGILPLVDSAQAGLARRIDWFASHPDAVVDASAWALQWAKSLAWDGPLGDEWRRLICA